MDQSKDWDGFCAWVDHKLRGKRAGKRETPGRIVLLLQDERGDLRRAVISLAWKKAEVLRGKSGDPALPKLLVRGRFDDWLEYLSHPTEENASQLAMFGDWRVMKTFEQLLMEKRSLLDIRAGR